MTEERLLEILKQCSTPLYLFDEESLHRRVELLRNSLPSSARLCYAVKANPFLAREVSPLVARLELCSPGEYAICDQLDLPPGQFVISGVYKDPAWQENFPAWWNGWKSAPRENFGSASGWGCLGKNS